MLYTTPIDKITWNMVEEFCAQRTVEGTYLDYKADFPSDLAKTISAMANTLGGVVLIGVAEDTEGKPRLPLTGIPFERGIAERVTNIVLTNVTPTVFPEVTVCVDSTGARALVVIRVPQSPEAPHAIQHNTRVYFRTGNRNNPEEIAALDRIDWLRSKRERSVELQKHLFEEAVNRSDVAFGHVTFNSGVRLMHHQVPPANLLLRVIPQFPVEQFKTPPELQSLFRAIQIPDYYGTDAMFPIGGSNPMLLQNGAYLGTTKDVEGGKRSYYTELSVFGQMFFRQTLISTIHKTSLIRASEIFCRLDEFARSAKKFFELIGYQGFVSFKCALFSAHSLPLGQWDPTERGFSTSNCPDLTIGYEGSFLVSDWDAEAKRIVTAAAQTIGWGYNWDITPPLLDRYYAANRR